jgi:hypothetical protein
VPHCPKCGLAAQSVAPVEVARRIAAHFPTGTVMLLAPLVRKKKGVHAELIAAAGRRGVSRVRIDGVLHESTKAPRLDRFVLHDVEAVVADLGAGSRRDERLRQAVERALALGGGTVIASAQEATVSGTVTDTTGGVLPGVTIRALHEATGNTFETVTNERGGYRLSLRIGVSRITAELQGFSQAMRTVELLVGQTAVVNLQMSAAGVAETVTVTGEAPLIETTQSSVGGNIRGRCRSFRCRAVSGCRLPCSHLVTGQPPLAASPFRRPERITQTSR